MTLFGRELTLEQLIGFVKCNAAPTEDLVHMAAVDDVCGACEALCSATGHGWKGSCYECQWWRGVKKEGQKEAQP